jgi:ribokinase
MRRRFDRFVVFGQIAQDLAIQVGDLPTPNESETVTELRWLLGGKGANQAVGLRQLGAGVAAVGVVGDDSTGANLLDLLSRDGIDVCGVSRRGSTATLIDLVDAAATRMLLEHVPAESLLTVADVDAAAGVVQRADAVCLQAQQPGEALTAAAALARRNDMIIALDGAPAAKETEELLAVADILRADATETEALVGFPVTSLSSGHRACRALLARGPSVVAVEAAGTGDLVAWRDGITLRPHDDAEAVRDRTGAGDAFFAGVVRGIGRGWSVERAADLAARCAASTVTRLGGRPDLRSLVDS